MNFSIFLFVLVFVLTLFRNWITDGTFGDVSLAATYLSPVFVILTVLIEMGAIVVSIHVQTTEKRDPTIKEIIFQSVENFIGQPAPTLAINVSVLLTIIFTILNYHIADSFWNKTTYNLAMYFGQAAVWGISMQRQCPDYPLHWMQIFLYPVQILVTVDNMAVQFVRYMRGYKSTIDRPEIDFFVGQYLGKFKKGNRVQSK